MFKNYISFGHLVKIAWRNILKRPGYSFINISGLGTGIAVCMLIVLFIRHELSYDDFHKDGDDVFRVVVDRKYPGRSTSYSNIPQSYAAAIKAECPEVATVVRLFDFLGGSSVQYKFEDRRFEENKVLFVDSTFFNVFDHGQIAGELKSSLDGPNSIVMTESTAKKYFGSVSNAIGKQILPEGVDPQPLQVTAVCADWPALSHFEFDILVSTAGNPAFRIENYVNFAAHTYIKMNAGSDFKRVESKFEDIIRKYAAGNIATSFAMPFEQFYASGNGYRYYLQPLKKIHLISQLESELKPNGSLKAIYIFGLIALIILVLAIINFVNLSTARSGERAREVGIRKTFGSEKNSLVRQFLLESLVISVCALIFSGLLVYLLIPYFNTFSNAGLSFNSLFLPSNFLLFSSLTFFTGLIAGLYPAFVLSSFRPITVLKGKFNSTAQGLMLRNGLVVFQFAISVILIICTLIVNQQMNYMTGNSLGYNKEQTIIIKRTDLLGDRTKTFKNELSTLPSVQSVSGASAFPGDNNYFGISWRLPGSAEPMTGRGIITDEKYQSCFDLELKEGRYFSNEYGTDSLALVLNEAAVKELGLKNPVGTTLTSEEPFLNAPGGDKYRYQIVGVIKDYNYQSLHQPIVPLIFTNASRFNEVSFQTAVKLKQGNLKEAIGQIEKKWSQFVTDRGMEYEFLDQTISRQYDAEMKTQRIFTFFAGLAIFIACIGLFGLAAFACQQRMKELSVRKVLGASTSGLITLLSENFIKLILLSLVIAFPMAWYLMHRWLQGFTYRVQISWTSFALAAGISLAIAFVTLSFQTVRASLANPIKSLRRE